MKRAPCVSNWGVTRRRVALSLPRKRVSLRAFGLRRCLLAVPLLLLFCSACGTTPTDRDGSVAEKGDFLERVTEKGPVKLVVRVSPPEPRLSDLVQMEVTVTFPEGVEVRSPDFGEGVGDFLVRDYSETKPPRSSLQDKGLDSRRFLYELEPTQTGRHLIRSLALEFVDRRPTSEIRDQLALIESEPLEVDVTSELEDQIPSLSDLDPMLPPRALDSSTLPKWWILSLAAIAAVAVVWWRYLRKRKRIAVSPPPSPEEIAHAELKRLLAEKLPEQGLVKEFYLRLTGIVRRFIEGTTGVRAPELTTEEFLRTMRTRDIFSAERAVRLKDFLEVADMVKYAGQQPSADQIELSISRAHEFVDLNRRQESMPISTEGN
ncbi:hypothetical protein [Schlesneria sp. DSM 10557]|uniref:hypothetical protein n=1 Tax=Schlesneria sp. DSM 10557 TaxID=3044399 RepID=UPI0035A162CB